MKFLFLIFFTISLKASFVQAVAVPDLIIQYENAQIKTKEGFTYQDVTVSLDYSSGILVFLPVGLWMETGIKLQELFYGKMLNHLMEPLRVQKMVDIIVKMANDQRVTPEEVDFVVSGVDLSFDIPYRPFRTRIDIEQFEKQVYLNIISNPQNDISYKSYNLAKVDVMHKDGFNFFFLFPKKEKLLIINNILQPPMVFCEYNGLFYIYRLNFATKKVHLYKEQFFDYSKLNRIRNEERKFFNKLTKKPQDIINKNIKEFLLIYSDYLKVNL